MANVTRTSLHMIRERAAFLLLNFLRLEVSAVGSFLVRRTHVTIFSGEGARPQMHLSYYPRLLRQQHTTNIRTHCRQVLSAVTCWAPIKFDKPRQSLSIRTAQLSLSPNRALQH